MIQAVRPSISALKAAGTSVAASASNIVNSRNTASLEDAQVEAGSRSRQSTSQQDRTPDDLYRPLRTDNVAVASGGVRAVLRERDPPHVVENAPDDPHADENGLVARPNVEIVDELVRMRQARTLYSANLKAIKTADEMAGYLVDDRA